MAARPPERPAPEKLSAHPGRKLRRAPSRRPDFRAREVCQAVRRHFFTPALHGRVGSTPKQTQMTDSVYTVIELVGTSTESWEKAVAAAVKQAAKSLRDLRIAEVSELDVQLEDGKIKAYRAKVKVSFKYEISS
jgi:flavin-binding protein dodecin